MANKKDEMGYNKNFYTKEDKMKSSSEGGLKSKLYKKKELKREQKCVQTARHLRFQPGKGSKS